MATEWYELKINGTCRSTEMQTGLVFTSDGVNLGETLVNGTDLITAFIEDAIDLWLAFQSEDYQIRRMTARRLSPHGSAVAHIEGEDGAWPGTVGEPVSALQTAPAIRLIPETLGATAGRCFLPSPPINLINNNAYDSAYEGAVTDFFQQCIDLIENVYQWHLGIHHRKTDTFSKVDTFNLSPRFGFQSRRRYPIG